MVLGQDVRVRLSTRLDVGAIFALALVLRVAIVARSPGGPLGDFGYDSSVYYNAAAALLHGRMPYADFTLLHPPALMLALTPFAAVGSITSDHTGFVVANTAFEMLGAVNAVLTLLVARRAGLGRFAAFAAGMFYALWAGAAGAEISARLEPLGNLLLLCGLLLLLGAPRVATPQRLVMCGACLGAAAVTKIWWIVPLAIVLGWAMRRSRRTAMLLATGAAASMALIAGVFFVRSPAAMWRMVVLDQLGRARIGGSIPSRLDELASVEGVLGGRPAPVQVLFVVALIVVVLAALVRAWRYPALRLVAAIGGAQLAVLLLAPTYFGFYADYLTPAAALVVGGALAAGPTAATAGRSALLSIRHVAIAVGLAGLLLGAGIEIVVGARTAVAPFPGAQLAHDASVAHLRCVMADSPMALIELDVLSRDLADGCPDRVDVSGSTYDVDRPPDGRHVPRRANARWQHDLYRYLLSGNAEIVIRHATGISPSTTHRLDRLPAIATVDGRTIRRTP